MTAIFCKHLYELTGAPQGLLSLLGEKGNTTQKVKGMF